MSRPGAMPRIESVMTPFPHFVGVDDSVAEVERLMDEHDIRHVPIQRDGEVVGIVSERDLHHLVNRALPQPSKGRIRVRDIGVPEPYVVEIHTPLSVVVREMADRHIGSAIVVKQGKLAGILSTTDVCRALAALLDNLYGSPSGDDAA